MTQDEVIATAKDAGLDGVILEMIAHTYKLGAEAEREVCAKVCDKAHPNTLPAMLGMQIRARGIEA